MSRHESHLASYLRSKKNSSSSTLSRSPIKNTPNEQPSSSEEKKRVVKTGVKGKANGFNISAAGSKTSHSARSSRKQVTLKERATRTEIVLLPDEVVLKIFRHLSPSVLLICAQVCHRWNTLTKERSLWENRISSFPKEVRDLFTFEETRMDNFDWRKETIKRALSLEWKLQFVDTRGQNYWVSADDVCYFASSMSVRWYSLPIPPLPQLASLAMFAWVPVFYNKGWKPHLNSATTKSLILLHDFKRSLSKETLSSKDEMITAHILPQALLASCWEVSWKNGGELAFVTSCLHYNDLLRKVLLGSKNRQHLLQKLVALVSTDRIYESPPHVPVLDDIDPQYGLHGYSATLELRNHKAAYWGHQYRELFQNEVCGECVILGSYGREHGVFNKRVSLPWKTELFRGILPNLAILDMTILDERKIPMWFVSAPVKVEPITDVEVDYMDGRKGDRYALHYSDNQGSVRIELVWSADECKSAVVNVELRILKSFVNKWFGTSY